MNKKGSATFFIVFLVVFIACLFAIPAYYDTVSAGHVGVTNTFGKVGDMALQPGIHGTGIFTSTIDMSTMIQREDYKASAASRDLQTVQTQVSVNYKLNPEVAPEIYKTIGLGYKDVIIYPVVQEAVKSVTATYTAEELITKRPEVKKFITENIINKVQDKGLIVTEVALTDFDFSPEFNKAIEAKQTAEQEALKAINEKKKAITQTEAITESQKLQSDANAYQVRVQAEAEAYALQVVREELQKSSSLIEYKRIEAWRDGGAQVPNTILGDSTNLLFGVN